MSERAHRVAAEALNPSGVLSICSCTRHYQFTYEKGRRCSLRIGQWNDFDDGKGDDYIR